MNSECSFNLQNRYMKIVKICCALFMLCFSSLSFCQSFNHFEVPVMVNNSLLKNPWVGGLNAPQYSNADFNNDGILDLFVFDRVGNVSMIFLNDGTEGEVSYKFAPEYLDGLPKLNEWVLMRDFDKDGIMDIFCYPVLSAASGIEVHKGYIENERLQFEQVKFPNFSLDIIPFTTRAGQVLNLGVTRIDIPALDDMDEDGDIDVLTFNLNGGKVEYYKNMSVERGFGSDSLLFILEDNCWGGIYETGDQPALDLSSSPGDCARRLTGVVDERHTGSTLLTFDMDNDCDKELLLGDLSFDNMVLAINGGNCDDAWVNKQDTFFPSYNLPIQIPSYPAAFHLDVNNDGHRDLIAAKNVRNGGEDINTSWLYINIGTEEFPDFSVEQNNFLTDQMLDFGSGANPKFFDYNGDGLIDLVVGNEGEYNRLLGSNSSSKLALFLNIGTPGNPILELEDDNWLDLERFSGVGGGTDSGFSPSFGDLNNDGFDDLLVGSLGGGFYYFENKATSQVMDFKSPIIKFQDIDVGRFSSIEILDVDSDGLNDILIGEQNGALNFLKNIGSPGNPQFEPDEDIAPNNNNFGKIDLREGGLQTGFGTPVWFQTNSNEFLVSGNEFGSIKVYEFNGLENEWPLLDANLGNTMNGYRTVPDFADIDNDGFIEMVVGNYRGGLTLYKTDLISNTVNTKNLNNGIEIKISPNPANESFNIQTENNGVWKLFDTNGKLLEKGFHKNNLTEISTVQYADGVYFLNFLSDDGESFSERILVNH